MSAQEAADYGLIDGIILNREEPPARRVGITPDPPGQDTAGETS
jgi:hypothetical protein